MKSLYLFLLLITVAFLSNFFSALNYIVPVILISPVFFENDIKSIGFKNFKRGVIWGFFASSVYIPFIHVDRLDIIQFLNILSFSVFEEIFFRGFMFKELKFIKNIHLKNVFVSALFSLSHIFYYLDPLKILVFFPSIVFGYLYIYSSSILAPIIFHFSSNLFYISFFYKKMISFLLK